MPKQIESSCPPITDEKALSLVGAHYPYAGGLRVLSRRLGAINQVFQIRAGNTDVALRIRHNEEGFQYEKGVFKEVAVAQLLRPFAGDPKIDPDRTLSVIWRQARHGHSNERIPFPAAPLLSVWWANLCLRMSF